MGWTKKDKPLTPKQRAFIDAYIELRNGEQAAIKAGYSPKAASTNATLLLKLPRIRKVVDAALKKVTDKAVLKAADVLAEIQLLSFVDNTAVFHEDGSVKPFSEWPEANRKSMSAFEVEELFAGRGRDRVHLGRLKKFKSTDKVRALEMLAKHFKLLTDRVEHTGAGGAPIAFIALPANGSEAEEFDSPKDLEGKE